MGDASSKQDVFLAILAHVFCLLIGAAAMGATARVIVTGQLLTIDGLGLVLTSMGIASFFIAHTAWAAYKGELKELFVQMRAKPELSTDDTDDFPPEQAKS